MTIENTFDRIASALERIAKTMEHTEPYAGQDRTTFDTEGPVTAPVPVPAPAVPAPVPAPTPVPTVPTVPTAPAPAVPIPVPAAPATAVAFTDSKGLMAYCMAKYKELGPSKGGMIQQILLELGVNNLTALPTEQYGEFYKRVEAL